MLVEESKPPSDLIRNRAGGLVGDTYRLNWSSLRFAHEMKKAMNELPPKKAQEFCDHVCAHLMLMGTMLQIPDRRILSLIIDMVKSEAISWTTVLNTFAVFNSFERPKCVEAICEILTECLPLISCDPRDRDECKQLSEAIERLLEWFLHGAQQSAKLSIDSLVPIAKCLQCYSENRFIHIVIYLRSQLDNDLLHRWQNDLDLFLKSSEMLHLFSNSTLALQLYLLVSECVGRLATKLPVDIPHAGKRSYLRPYSRPTISTLITVYAGFRMLKGVSEICDACLILADTFEITGRDVLVDIMRTAVLLTALPDELHERTFANIKFTFQMVPLLTVQLLKRGRITREDIFATLEHLCSQRAVLDGADRTQKCLVFQTILEQISCMPELGISMEDLRYLQDLRYKVTKREDIERHEPSYLAAASSSSSSSSSANLTPNPSMVKVFFNAKRAKKTLDKWDTDHQNWQGMTHLLVRSSGATFDAICAWSALDGTLRTMYSKLITVNTIWRMDHQVFDTTFLLLTRLRMFYTDLELDNLSYGSTKISDLPSFFYKWNLEVSRHLEEGTPMKADEAQKLNFATKYAELKQGKLYWDSTWQPEDLMGTIPIIGEMILDDIRMKVIPPVTPTVDILTHPVSRILTTYMKMPSMVVVLIEWLSTQKCDADRQIFVRGVTAVINASGIAYTENDRWMSMVPVVRPLLNELIEEAKPAEMPYPWIVQCARRVLPSIRRHTSPDMQQLKDAFLYACRQNWASPNVIALVDKCDRHNNMWCKVWFLQMIKSVTLDELSSYSEICIATAFCAPIHFFVALHRHIVDHVLNLDNHSAAITHPLSIVLSRMLVRLMILAVWANKQRFDAHQKKEEAKAAQVSSTRSDVGMQEMKTVEAESKEGEESTPLEIKIKDDKDVEAGKVPYADAFGPNGPVMKTIELTMNRFFKETMTGHLKPTTSFIIKFLIELAQAPRNEYWKDVVARIPIDLLYSLGRIDPYSITIDVFMTLYSDLSDVETNLNCLKFACVHRKMRVY